MYPIIMFAGSLSVQTRAWSCRSCWKKENRQCELDVDSDDVDGHLQI